MRLALITAGCAAAAHLFHASTADAEIRWLNGPQEIQHELAPAQIAERLSALSQRDESRRVLVRLTDPITKEDKAYFADAGLNLLQYVSDNAYFATIDRDMLDAEKISRVLPIASVEAVSSEWKLHPDLADGTIHPWSIVGEHLVPRFDGDKADPGQRPRFEFESDVAVYVNFHADVDIDTEGAEAIRKLGGEIRSLVRSTNMIVAHLPASHIEKLSEVDAVMYIEPPLPLLSTNNAENRVLTNVDAVNAAPYGLSGSGINVLVFDGGQVLGSHLGFTTPPIIGLSDTAGVSDHSTHVAGTIGGGDTGAAGIDGSERGMSPNVQIVSYGFEQPGGLSQGFLYTDPGDLEADYLEALTLYGVDIANNSIGTNTAPNGYPCDWEGNYNNTSILIDSIVRGSLGSPFRVVWANGNERQGSQRCGATYQTTAPPACAKNHIAVGSLDSDTDGNSSFTSWGPADDDRMKPDIAAPGCQVGGDGGVRSFSSSGNTSYTVKCGTSMAAPTVTGICALILEDWRTLYSSEPDPRNSTLKSLLAHTAVDIEDAGPDFKTGYGSVRADAAIDQLRSGNLLEAEVDQSTSYLATVVVVPGDPELRVTIAWDDAPSTPLAAAVLVNDLDLVVHSPTGTRAYPWTLGGLANPGALAIRTQENHVDNIEQVFVQNPEAGAWFIEVRGTTVPSGPQPFSLVASPFLVNCSDEGILAVNGNKFNCADIMNITVIDCGPNSSDQIVDTVKVRVTSDTEPVGEVVTLFETDSASAKFTATIATSTVDSPGVLAVTAGDTITTTYTDADDGTGSQAIVIKLATADCTPPVITNVVVADVQPRDATITLDTDEDATVIINYGNSCGILDQMEITLSANTSHSVLITGLTDETDYFFSVDATDTAGNSSSDDNSGACYTFTTPDIPDFFTEQFAAGSDLAGTALFLAPSAGVDQYDACSFPIAGFPTDPTGGTTLGVADDTPVNVSLTGGNSVSLYGTSYTDVWVAPNGYITLGISDSTYTETFADHFENPRVAALFDDLNPTDAGTVSWKEEADRAVFTWDAVQEYSSPGILNSFQIEMFFDGSIQISWVDIQIADFIAGISEGTGLDPDFLPSDLSSYGSCGPRPPFAQSASYTVAEGTPFPFSISGSDDGLPNPPATLAYTIASLPAQPLRDATTNLIINSVPYMLAPGDTDLVYEPAAFFVGADSFTFIVDDGGSPPDGGESAPATINFFVEGTLPLPFFDDFPSASFDPIKWNLVQNVNLDGVGIAEPSEPNSARFNGSPDGDDTIETALLNADGYSDLTLTYWYQETGGGETPDTDDDLWVEYQDSVGNWHEVARHLGSIAAMTTYIQESVLLPPGAAHAQLRIRFVCFGTSGTTVFDDWFVDDIGLDGTPPASCEGDANGDNVIDVNDISYVLFRLGDPCAASGPPTCDGDANNDGTIDVNDISYVLFRLGNPC
jgi:hypothetical protein